ncbi:hypothetical protein ABTK63_20550, partial [Acinetobacter baumannii]
ISTSQNNICSGASVTFNSIITNGGSSPKYQWKKNGVNVGTNSYYYTTSSLKNNDVITCELTSNAPCNIGVVTSNSVAMIVNANLIPSI